MFYHRVTFMQREKLVVYQWKYVIHIWYDRQNLCRTVEVGYVEWENFILAFIDRSPPSPATKDLGVAKVGQFIHHKQVHMRVE